MELDEADYSRTKLGSESESEPCHKGQKDPIEFCHLDSQMETSWLHS